MVLKIPRPSPKQLEFLLDEHRFLAYGGARGGGKSWALRIKAVLLCFRYPGIKVMIVRKTYPELQENHILPLCSLLRCHHEREGLRFAEYNDAKKHILFPNGSRIIFRYCDDDSDVQRFQGTEVDAMLVDEATQQTEERIQMLWACVRGVNDFPKRFICTMNPGGVGHEWVKRRFIDRRFKEGENPEDYHFIQSLVTDNTALMEADPNYIKNLQALPEPLRKAWLEGCWDIYQGQFFDDFRTEPDIMAARAAGFEEDGEELRRQRRFTHVIEAFRPPRDWTVFRSYDFGYSRPFSCAWWAVDHDGVMYRIMELYGCGAEPNQGIRHSPQKQFEEIARLEREHPWLSGRQISGVADPSIWDASRGESIAETAAACGVYFTPGDNRRIAGWMQCHYRLQFDREGYPGMYVFDNCKDFIRTLPTLRHSQRLPEDLDSEGEDHAADEWRYACMSRPVTPPSVGEEKAVMNDPLNRF